METRRVGRVKQVSIKQQRRDLKLVRHRTDSPWRTWGHRPRNSNRHENERWKRDSLTGRFELLREVNRPAVAGLGYSDLS